MPDTLAQYLGEVLTPGQFTRMIAKYGGARHYLPHRYNYAKRNEAIRKRFEEMREKGVRYTDAVEILARECCLSAKRISNLLTDTRG